MNSQLLYCLKCNSELKEGINFCPKCGSRVKEQITKELSNITETIENEKCKNNSSIDEIRFDITFEILKCTNCRTELQDNVNFCSNCGNDVRVSLQNAGFSETGFLKEEFCKNKKGNLQDSKKESIESIKENLTEDSLKNKAKTKYKRGSFDKVVKFAISLLLVLLLGCGIGYFFQEEIDTSLKTFGIIKDKIGTSDDEDNHEKDLDIEGDTVTIEEKDAKENEDNQSQDTITLAKPTTPEPSEEEESENRIFHSMRPTGEVIKLGDYKEVVIDVEAPVITDQEIEKEIYDLLSTYANYVTVTDRKDIRNGDIVNINYVGTIDGEEFDEGSDESPYGTDIVIGSNSYIEGFDEQLVGAMVGETTIVSIILSKDYGNDYVGKEVIFRVSVNFIREEQLPELTDEFIWEKRGFSTVDEYISSLKVMLLNEKNEAILASASFQAMKNIMDATVIIGISNDEITKYCNNQMKVYESYAIAYGMDIEDFCMEFFSESYENLYEEMRVYAEEAIKQNMILFTIADREGLTISEEEYTKEGELFAWLNNYASLEEMLTYCSKEEIMEYMLLEKAHKLITDHIIINYN